MGACCYGATNGRGMNKLRYLADFVDKYLFLMKMIILFLCDFESTMNVKFFNNAGKMV